MEKKRAAEGNTSKRVIGKLPGQLSRYDNVSFEKQRKVLFLYYLIFSVFGSMIFIISYSIFLQLNNPGYGGIYLPIILPEISVLFVVIGCYLFLIKGHFTAAAHLLLLFTMAVIWSVVYLDVGTAISRLDNVFFILAVLTMLPLLIISKKWVILLYMVVNLGVFYLLTGILKNTFEIPKTSIADFKADFTMALLFIGVVGFNIFRVNKQTLNKALSDFNEKLQAERALMESQQQFLTLARTSPVGIFRVGPDNVTTYVNSKWTEITGLKFEDTTDNGWMKSIHPDDKERVLKGWQEGFLKRMQSGANYRIVKPDNSVSWVLSNIIPEFVNGEFKGFIGTITDVTGIKKANEELKRYRNHLEQLVNERTSDLATANEKLRSTNDELAKQREELQEAYIELMDAQNKLVQAEKMASLGVLAAGIAHEINNPLNFISGGAMALESFINEKMGEYRSEVAPLIQAIQLGVNRSAEIVSSLNLYSRRDDLPGTECNINTVIDNCLVMLNNEIKYRIEVFKRYSEDPIQVFGNEGRFHQVFLNVLANAVQAITDTGIIEISTTISENLCVVSIEDNGTGMSKELLPKITDPFFTTKDPGKGTGLGLSITYNILKDYDGTIEFESEVGKGTRVTITLPVAVGSKQ